MAGRQRAGAGRLWPEAFVGRGDLLQTLGSMSDRAAAGSGGVVLLTGEAGIGKTSIVRAVAAAAAADGLTVTWGRCASNGTAPPFWPWRDLLDTAEPLSEHLSVADTAIGAQRFERLHDLAGVVLRRVREQPRLHVIEDLQWADVASVLLLDHLAESIGDEPLLVIATIRTGEAMSPPLEAALEEIRRSAEVRTVTPLEFADVQELMHLTGMPVDDDLAATVVARTGANPLLVTELIRAVNAHEGPARVREALAGAVPARVSELVTHRLRRMPQAVAELVVVASVLGIEGDAATLAAMTGASIDAVLDLIEQARAARLLDTPSPARWQFRHDLVRDAVHARMTVSERARAHATAVDVLAASDPTAHAVLAHHALAALPLFDADRAVALAARAGESALDALAYEEAIDWFRCALATAPSNTSTHWRAELLVRCGEAHRHVGDIDAARQSFLEAAALTTDERLLARAALGYADPGADLGIAYRTGDVKTASLLSRAIDAQAEKDSLDTVLLESRLAAELYFSDEPGRSRQLAVAACDRASRVGDPIGLAAAGTVYHDAFVIGQVPLQEQLRHSEQLLAWAHEAGTTAALLAAHRARVFDLLAAGDLPAMDAEILAFRRVAEPLKAPGYLWWPAIWSAMRALLEGDHELAEGRAMGAFHIGQRPFASLAFSNLSFLLFFLRREQGRLAEFEGPTREYAASHADIPAIRVALVFLLAELGRVDEARGLLASFDAEGLQGLHDRNWPASWFQLARAAFLVGDRRLATELLDEERRPTEHCIMVSLATACLGSADLATAWLFETTGNVDAATHHYSKAEETNARIGARSWLEQTRVDRARLAAPPEPSVQPSERPAAIRHGAVWQLTFGGRTVQLPHARGLTDLAHLLARPGEPVSVLDLVSEPGAARRVSRGAEVLDDRARREIRERLRELDGMVADAESEGDGERAALAREQRQQLAEAVARDLGLGGRSRRLDDPIERARKTVSTRIRRAIVAVAAVHPELGRHLQRSIDTGTWCAYRPAEPVHWMV